MDEDDLFRLVASVDEDDLLDFAARVDDVDGRRAWERRCDERLESLREGCRRRRGRLTNSAVVNFLLA